jgi:hypothetical protein
VIRRRCDCGWPRPVVLVGAAEPTIRLELVLLCPVCEKSWRGSEVDQPELGLTDGELRSVERAGAALDKESDGAGVSPSDVLEARRRSALS